jgi:hypothetical protein
MSADASASPPSTKAAGRRAALSVGFLAAGVALLVWQIRALDLTSEDLGAGFRTVGAWFLVVLALSAARFIVRSYAWGVLLDVRVPLRALFKATIAGDALGNLTPLGLVASEPTKALYLRRSVDPTIGLAALTAENVFYSISVALYIMVSAAAMLAFFPLPPAVEVAGVMALVSMAATLLVIGWFAWKRPSVLSAVVRRVPIDRVRTLADRIQRFEGHAYGAVSTSGSRLVRVALLEASFHLFSLVECWLIFWLLTGQTSLLPALVFDGVNRVVNVLFKQVPLRLGVEEVSTAMVAAAIGLAAHDGFMLALVRKARVVVWAVGGLALLSKALAGGSTKDEG